MDIDELEAVGCRTFACPSLSSLDEKGKELGLRDTTIKKAKDMAIEYLKKTYHSPHYSSFTHLLPSFLFIASRLDGNMIYKKRIEDVFGTSGPTVNKWNKDIVDTLCLKMTDTGKGFVPDEPIREVPVEFVCPDLEILDIMGKDMCLKDETIKKAKELAVMYFEINNCCNPRDEAFPALLYIASFIKNDKRLTHMTLAMMYNTNVTILSRLSVDIVDILKLKVTRTGSGSNIESISE